jgi:heavy metal sensor kinase
MISIDRHHIRTRMTTSFVGVLAAVLLLYSFAAGFFLLRDLRSQLIRYAIQDIETVEGLLYFTPQGQLKLRDDYHNHAESKDVLERLLEVRSPEGNVLYRNDLLGNGSLGDSLLPGEGQGGYSAREFRLADGLQVQLVSRRHSVDGHPTIIRVAYSQSPLHGQFRSALLSLLLPLPVVLAVAGIGGYVLASRSLRPIQQLARQAAQISSDRLHERLPVNVSDGELAELARVFNTVLVRLEQSFEQLRRFTSDASHELRTPLAAMRSVGEVGLRKNHTPEHYRDVIGSMLEETNKLTQLVDSLLTIARADAGHFQLNPTVFPAAKLAEECASIFEPLLEENHQQLVIEKEETCILTGDWLLLRQAVFNVVHNAIKYTPHGGMINIRNGSSHEEAFIEVTDAGPGIPADQLSKIFDRFYRVGEGRSRETGGVGLGLAIARWSVEIHGGTVTARNAPEGGCTFRISLPARPDLQTNMPSRIRHSTAERTSFDPRTV